jgi:hypothetical protein
MYLIQTSNATLRGRLSVPLPALPILIEAAPLLIVVEALGVALPIEIFAAPELIPMPVPAAVVFG